MAHLVDESRSVVKDPVGIATLANRPEDRIQETPVAGQERYYLSRAASLEILARSVFFKLIVGNYYLLFRQKSRGGGM